MTIEERMTRLERANRRWRLVAIVAISFCGLTILTAAEPAEIPVLKAREIRCRQITVTDEGGTAGVTIASGEKGAGAILVGTQEDYVGLTYQPKDRSSEVEFGVTGKPKMRLITDSDTAAIFIGGSDDTHSLILSSGPNFASLDMATLDRRTVTVKTTSAGGCAFISTMDGESYGIYGKGATNVQLDNRKSPATAPSP